VFVKLNDLYSTSSGNIVIDSTHALVNQRDEPVFMVGKRSLFPKATDGSKLDRSPPTAHPIESLCDNTGYVHDI
jgi:hypothetical protein